MNLRRLLYCCLLLTAASCSENDKLFKKLSSQSTGIHFINRIVETDSMNPLDIVNIYNGGGVGIGDFNNDGLQDIYFTGNQVAGQLYLNKGELEFTDVTKVAGVEGMGRWARGVAVVDINNDGLQDLYISNNISPDSTKRRNILYINTGINKQGVPVFRDMAADYGLEVFAQSTMANFFDYDNDGDLDVYITVNAASSFKNPSVFHQDRQQSKNTSVGRLYRNDHDSSKKHPFFTDVSASAGMVIGGYGHASTICDLNRDGWKDIYVSNDFVSPNILYINNHDGTFTDRAAEYFKHTSYNAMGQDVIDINNDGLSDVFELDMSPRDNYRRKMMLNANSYVTFQNFATYGFQYQYVRNTLQLNRGPRLLENDSVGAPLFSEISFMSNVAQTDWSWTPLITDFDNDGFRDIIVTNGFPKDVTDHDFIAFREKSAGRLATMDILQKIPEIKLHNYAFRNKDGLIFDDVTDQWGLSEPSYANGAAWADLDNDGDLDMVINNINDEAEVYQNTTRSKETKTGAGYLQVVLQGDSLNRSGFGAWVSVYYGNKMQAYEYTPYRGYLSTNQQLAHFGLDSVAILDSLVVEWQDGSRQVAKGVKPNQVLTIKYDRGLQPALVPQPAFVPQPGSGLEQQPGDSTKAITRASLFKEITKRSRIQYIHRDLDFIDFNIQTTLPHKLSEYCPALASGDVNGDGLDDMIIGGNEYFKSQLFLQQQDGHFIQRALLKSDSQQVFYKDGAVLLTDVNGDGSPDLYITSAGFQYDHGSKNYQDRLYINDGRGNFTIAKDALPANTTSKLCVRSFDYNKDGRADLVVSGRVDPWNYPKPASSFIYRNDTKDGRVVFTDVTATVAPGLKDLGLVCDVLVTDFDNDQQPDLLFAGEWMPVTFFRNNNGKFENVTLTTGIAGSTGWWNSIQGGDFRHTGRTDYIIGNTGLNTLYKATEQYPVFITAKDFDNNGGYEAIPSLYLPDPNGKMAEFPAHGRDDLVDRLPLLKKRFTDYHSLAVTGMDQLFAPEQSKDAQRLKVTNSQSVFLRNDGNGKFTMIPLPTMAQVSMLNGMVADDFDGDGNLDLLLNGNDFGTEVSVGRYDALNGLLLRGDGSGSFTPLSVLESGIYIPGNGKALTKLRAASGSYLVAASQQLGELKLFELRNAGKPPAEIISWKMGDVSATITYTDGRLEKKENYIGNSFLSQSAGFFLVNAPVKKIAITNSREGQRVITK